ncbi:prolyl aminopeptidase [Solwaraspora sp. WMMA2056]|uniref:prolyl aminopeptidase n=1 Tax=Solwaraspora sp. WMMA2056 TaxID=3015161 RepID=UPI00259B3569|nr:prolyl aminopeptidase [Solwaraspora sp. WMMA2056]WJK38935.1 prolyl aminopeptidase [Solwaraspora sp. WMMA2056]
MIEPYDTGMLDVGDGHQVYWEVCGNPDGVPAVVLHGGPGSGCTPRHRRALDPERFRLVLFDQRNCGRSTPAAADPATDLSANTTAHLVADIERLRQHLGVDRWVVYGGSWGATLALAYATNHPERVRGMILVAVTMTRRSEVDWLYRGAGRFFPEAWQRFIAHAGLPGYALPTDTEPPIEPVLLRYGRLLADPDPAVRQRAADEWCAWEDALISEEHNGNPGAYSAGELRQRLTMTRICAHYFGNGAFLADGEILRNVPKLAGIPGVLVHGRADVSGPAITPWEIAQAWPDARLHVIGDAGHTGTATMRRVLADAADTMAQQTGAVRFRE